MWIVGMTYLGKAWRFVRRYWYVFAIAIGAIITILVRPRSAVSAIDDIADQLVAASEEAWVERVQATSGRDVALDAVKSRYVEEANALNEKERLRARELESNPQELAHLLLTAGRSRRRRTKL